MNVVVGGGALVIVRKRNIHTADVFSIELYTFDNTQMSNEENN